MRRDRWLRSTPFRLLLSFSLLTLVNVLLAFLAAWFLIGRELRVVEDRRIAEIAANAETELKDVDLADRAAVAAKLDAVVPNDGTLFAMTAGNGKTIAGNTAPVTLDKRWDILPPETFDADTDVNFRVFHTTVRGQDLLIARPQTALDETKEVLLASFVAAASIVLLAGVGGGAVLAMRAKARIDRISSALALVGKGDLTVRIVQSQRGDDIDRLVGSINQTIAQLEANVGALRQLSVDIAHDLRTPLNRLHIRLEEAASQLAAGRLPGVEIDDALAQSESIGAAFSALLRIAQIEAGARREQFQDVDLAAIASSAAEAYESVAEDAGMTLTLTAENPVQVKGDRDLLLQAVANLVENAICHCPVGTRITLDVVCSAGAATLAVADNGPGIPATERDNVLKRHYRLERSRTTPGFGLGLSLVKAIADLHSAELSIGDAKPGLRVALLFQDSASKAL